MPVLPKYTLRSTTAALRSATRSFIYVFGLKNKECVKIGKCKGSPWNRVRHGQLARVVCPRTYKTQMAEPGNLRLVHCFAFPEHVDVHAVERAFHKRHRELARCGEWYPEKDALDRLRRFVGKRGGHPVDVPSRSVAPKQNR